VAVLPEAAAPVGLEEQQVEHVQPPRIQTQAHGCHPHPLALLPVELRGLEQVGAELLALLRCCYRGWQQAPLTALPWRSVVAPEPVVPSVPVVPPVPLVPLVPPVPVMKLESAFEHTFCLAGFPPWAEGLALSRLHLSSGLSAAALNPEKCPFCVAQRWSTSSSLCNLHAKAARPQYNCPNWDLAARPAADSSPLLLLAPPQQQVEVLLLVQPRPLEGQPQEELVELVAVGQQCCLCLPQLPQPIHERSLLCPKVEGGREVVEPLALLSVGPLKLLDSESPESWRR